MASKRPINDFAPFNLHNTSGRHGQERGEEEPPLRITDLDAATAAIGGYRFEIHGKVQGVVFRKYTQRRARQIVEEQRNGQSPQGSNNIGSPKLVGWIRNTGRGTVEGEVASTDTQSRRVLQDWLRTTGSPKCHIVSADFIELDQQRAERLLRRMDDFEIRKTTAD